MASDKVMPGIAACAAAMEATAAASAVSGAAKTSTTVPVKAADAGTKPIVPGMTEAFFGPEDIIVRFVGPAQEIQRLNVEVNTLRAQAAALQGRLERYEPPPSSEWPAPGSARRPGPPLSSGCSTPTNRRMQFRIVFAVTMSSCLFFVVMAFIATLLSKHIEQAGAQDVTPGNIITWALFLSSILMWLIGATYGCMPQWLRRPIFACLWPVYRCEVWIAQKTGLDRCMEACTRYCERHCDCD